jgi:dihydroorotate dehydrogenase
MFKFIYKYCFKPIAFSIDPERIHDIVTYIGKILGNIPITNMLVDRFLNFKHISLEQDILGIKFTNPIGLSAGFDKNAELYKILPSVGFGFAELGSITGEMCLGNSKKRLWRLPKSKSLLVYYGLMNDGAIAISKRLQGVQFKIPIGISVAKTNCKETVDINEAINDYLKAFKAFDGIGSYVTINISCPNTFGGQPFTDPLLLNMLLEKIDQAKTAKPIFIKLSPDLDFKNIDSLLEVIGKHNVQGIICSNLTKNRNNTSIVEKDIPEVGGFSGKAVEELSNNLISYVYKKTRSKYVIIGSGGVFSAEDAYTKIKLGASLIQIITGMVYEGPQLIGEINRGLVELLKRDGYKNISEAVGVGNV